jgi:hypothetical protein
MTDFRVFRWEALRGGFRREHSVHLQKKWKVFSTTDPYFKGFSRFVSSGDALWFHKGRERLLPSSLSLGVQRIYFKA